MVTSEGTVCITESCFETVNSMDGVGILLRAMETHMKNAKVVKNICMVLTTLVEPNGRLWPMIGEGGGIGGWGGGGSESVLMPCED